MRRFLATLFVVTLSATLAVGLTAAEAVIVGAMPTWPIPSDVAAGPPPIAAFPIATETAPPAGVIADPVRPNAACGEWSPQSSYGDRWPAGSTWWEYRCTDARTEYHNTCPGPACDAFCPSCHWLIEEWTDHFYWDGSDAVFYGEAYTASFEYDSGDSYSFHHWWDAPTAQWHNIGNAYPTASFTVACSGGDCSFDASSSSDSDGSIQGYSWYFGDGSSAVESGATVAHSYVRSGSYTVALTVTDDDGGSASAWSVVTVDLPIPNAAPQARFVWSCSALSCSLDGAGSTDSDGAITNWSWSFGDGATGAGATAQHAYAQPGTHTVALTVTDDAGATATVTDVVLTIRLTASGYKVKGLQKVDLIWTDPGSQQFEIYRNGAPIATVVGTAYTDSIGRKGQASYVYELCGVATETCSNEATVVFR